MNQNQLTGARLDRAISALLAQRRRLNDIYTTSPAAAGVAHEMRLVANELMVAAVCLQSQQRTS